MEGEIVSGMMEGETLQLALSQYAALSSVMIRDNSVSSSPGDAGPESCVVRNPIINTVIS